MERSKVKGLKAMQMLQKERCNRVNPLKPFGLQSVLQSSLQFKQPVSR